MLSLLNNIDFQNKILNNFKDRIINFDKRKEKFFNDSIENIIKNINILHKKIKIDNKTIIKNISKDKLILDYISKIDNYKINQKTS